MNAYLLWCGLVSYANRKFPASMAGDMRRFYRLERLLQSMVPTRRCHA